jgi:hypothetical protein
MISSLEVGSVFRLVDEASPTLKLITDQLKLLNEQADAAKKAMTSISETAFAGLNTRIGSVTDSLKGIGDVGATAAEKMASSFDAATLTMSASLKKMAEQMSAMKIEGAPLALSGGAGRGGNGGLLGGPSSLSDLTPGVQLR